MKQVCAKLPMSADNVTLLASAAAPSGRCHNQSISSASWAHSSSGMQWLTDGTDGQCTVTWTLPHTVQAESIILQLCNFNFRMLAEHSPTVEI